MKPALLILAAGMATRYGGLKQLESVGPAGEALLDYGIFDARRAGFDRIVLVIRREIEEPMRAHATRLPAGPLAFVFQDSGPPAGGVVRTRPWGTAHAVLCARAEIAGPFAVVNADDFYGRAAFERLAAHLGGAAATGESVILAWPLAATLSGHGGVSRAVCAVSADGLLTGITEMHGIAWRGGEIIGRSAGRELALDPATPVSMNFWGFTPDVFARLERGFATFQAAHGSDADAEYRLPDAVASMIGQGWRVRVLTAAGHWIGMTFAADREHVRSRIAGLVGAGEYPPDLAVEDSVRKG